MKIVEVASLREALSIKAEKNHVGDYMIQTWENGRELVVQLEDSPIYYRWKEEVVKPEVEVIVSKPEENESTPKESTPITAMEG